MIAIYSDAHIFGGIQILIVRLSYFLADRNIPFVLVATKGTRISDELHWANQVDPRDLPNSDIAINCVFFPHVCILKQEIAWEKFSDSRVFCWLVHPTEIFTSFFPVVNALLDRFGYPFSRFVKVIFRSHNRIVSHLLQTLVSGGGLVVMDGATRRGLEYFFPEVKGECGLIPIPSPVGEVVHKRSSANRKISIGYLGRLDQFKASALVPFISYDLADLSKEYEIEMHFVAEGNCLDLILDLCARHNISAHSHGFLPNDEARRLIRDRTDFAACMGTAALDIAASGHPCIIIDPSLERAKTPQRLFRFVDELEEFTLGEFRDFGRYKPGLHLLKDVVLMVRSDPFLGARGAAYVREHHNPQSVFASLLSAIQDSEVMGRDVATTSSRINRSYSSIDKRIRGLVPRFVINLIH